MDTPKITISARRNGDGTYRGLVWRGDEKEPLIIVGIDMADNYYEQKNAIAAARAEAKREGFFGVRTISER